MTDKDSDLLGKPGVRDYALACLVALLVQTVVLLQDDLGLWSLLPALVGVAALLARWSIGPPLVLLTTAGFYLAGNRWRYASPDPSPLTDVPLAVALLVYVAAAYRLQALTRHVFPPETRRLRRSADAPALGPWLTPDAPRQRAPAAVRPRELAELLAAAVALGVLAQLAWLYLVLVFDYPGAGLPRGLWLTLIVVWSAGASAAVALAVVGYFGWRQWTPAEARVFLVDQLWRELRREQAQVWAWIIWARLFGKRGKLPSRGGTP